MSNAGGRRRVFSRLLTTLVTVDWPSEDDIVGFVQNCWNASPVRCTAARRHIRWRAAAAMAGVPPRFFAAETTKKTIHMYALPLLRVYALLVLYKVNLEKIKINASNKIYRESR
ncbi:unnamed protein product [Cuscuta europaea]|uniref:Uncharacterized protein n=1 Tax=Cuscuta europaea TaxID=41803 RepID=A0A9P0YT36_CUSEU|nr:unnamed protein product [Cuscuta europaea]